MAEWLGNIIGVIFYWGLELLTWLVPSHKTEWQKSWEKKKGK